MNLRPFVLTFATLLLLIPFASAGQTPAPANSPSEILAAIFSNPAPTDCVDAKLPSFEIAPVETSVLCGACSDTICQGKQFGQYCKFQNGKFYYCQPAYVRCDPNDCQCWTGPLP